MDPDKSGGSLFAQKILLPCTQRWNGEIERVLEDFRPDGKFPEFQSLDLSFILLRSHPPRFLPHALN